MEEKKKDSSLKQEDYREKTDDNVVIIDPNEDKFDEIRKALIEFFENL